MLRALYDCIIFLSFFFFCKSKILLDLSIMGNITYNSRSFFTKFENVAIGSVHKLAERITQQIIPQYRPHARSIILPERSICSTVNGSMHNFKRHIVIDSVYFSLNY